MKAPIYAYTVLAVFQLCNQVGALSSLNAYSDISRRSLIAGSGGLLVSAFNPDQELSIPIPIPIPNLQVLEDPDTYSSLLYKPPDSEEKKLPLIVFLHGAGKNQRDISNLADIQGEYGGLLPSLIANNKAPKELLDNFIVVSPYAFGKTSFYDEPRSKMLNFISYAAKHIPQVDPSRIFLFGFSDGATLSVELLTTQRFAGGVICSYGYTGILPDLALQRLAGLPLWVFHSADDAIFRVQNSDQLVKSLMKDNGSTKYTRFDKDPEGFTGSVRGHTTGITASRDPHVYEWLLSIPPAKSS